MKESLLFTKEWMKNPLQAGALFQTSNTFAKRICSAVDYSNGYILELGAGLGNITAHLAPKIDPAKFACVEIEQRFYTHLKQKFPNLHIIKGSAENLETLLPEMVGKVRCIVSLIPMVSLKPALRQKILQSCLNMLDEKGFILQGSYYWKPITTHLQAKIEHIDFIWKNMPPIHIYKYTKI